MEHTTGRLDDLGVPHTETSQVTTNVIVPDGKTIVLGGIIHPEVPESQGYLSMLSWIPYVGPFCNTEDSTTKNELLLCLTPRVWKQ